MSITISDEPTVDEGRPALAEPVGKRDRWGVLRQHDFRRLWIGETTSKFGSAITGIALPLVAVVTLHSSALSMGLLTAMSWLPFLLVGLPAGALVDRWPRRTVMLVCNSAALVLLVSVPILAWVHALSMGYLLFVAFGSGVGGVFFQPAYGAYLPSIVASDDLGEANGKLEGSAQAAFIGGSGIGGLIAQIFGAVSGIFIDAITYVVAVVSVFSIKTKEPRPAPSDEPRTLRQDIAAGVKFLVRDPYLRIIALSAAVENLLLSGALALLILFLSRVVGAHSGEIGVLMIADSFGGMLGATLAMKVARRIGTARALLAISILSEPFGLLIPLTSNGIGLVFFLIGMGVPAAGMVACGIISYTFRQQYCPPELQGRVSTAAMVIVYGSMPIGALVAGVLGDRFGITQTLWIMLGGLALAKLLRLIGPIKSNRDLPTEPAVAV
jgi:MFS family permease